MTAAIIVQLTEALKKPPSSYRNEYEFDNAVTTNVDRIQRLLKPTSGPMAVSDAERTQLQRLEGDWQAKKTAYAEEKKAKTEADAKTKMAWLASLQQEDEEEDGEGGDDAAAVATAKGEKKKASGGKKAKKGSKKQAEAEDDEAAGMGGRGTSLVALMGGQVEEPNVKPKADKRGKGTVSPQPGDRKPAKPVSPVPAPVLLIETKAWPYPFGRPTAKGAAPAPAVDPLLFSHLENHGCVVTSLAGTAWVRLAFDGSLFQQGSRRVITVQMYKNVFVGLLQLSFCAYVQQSEDSANISSSASVVTSATMSSVYRATSRSFVALMTPAVQALPGITKVEDVAAWIPAGGAEVSSYQKLVKQIKAKSKFQKPAAGGKGGKQEAAAPAPVPDDDEEDDDVDSREDMAGDEHHHDEAAEGELEGGAVGDDKEAGTGAEIDRFGGETRDADRDEVDSLGMLRQLSSQALLEVEQSTAVTIGAKAGAKAFATRGGDDFIRDLLGMAAMPPAPSTTDAATTQGSVVDVPPARSQPPEADSTEELVVQLCPRHVVLPWLSNARDRIWAVFLCHGGYFAGAVFVGGHPVLHRALHRYVVRRGQGGKQSNQEGIASSAGSQIRRMQEIKFRSDVREVLDRWREMLNRAAMIAFGAPGPDNKVILGDWTDAPRGSRLASLESPVRIPQVSPRPGVTAANPIGTSTHGSSGSGSSASGSVDPRVFSIPMSTHRPTFQEVTRVYEELSTWEVQEQIFAA